MKTVAFVTDHAHASLESDDLLVVPELEKRGVRVVPVIWTDASVDWKQFAAVVVRSTWNYTERLPEFREWLAHLRASGILLFNPVSVLLWNTDKVYLRELAAAGVPIVPTEWLDGRAKSADVSQLLSELRASVGRRGWDRFVLKSSVSAAGARTYCLDSENVARGSAEVFEALMSFNSVGTLMVQEFMSEVQTEGEWSLLFYGGKLSHALLKRPRSGEFLSQHFHGGTFEQICFSDVELDLSVQSAALDSPAANGLRHARAALLAGEKICGARALYARVDMIRRGSVFYLGELEMVEPCLFFGVDAGAPQRFAEALLARLA